jgi:transcriptional regulator with XRE-family HTH domain
VSFGQKLKMYRERADMTQKELAGQIGMHPTYLGFIENDRVNPPKLINIVRISKVLQLSKEEFDDLIQEVVSQAEEDFIRQANEMMENESEI